MKQTTINSFFNQKSNEKEFTENLKILENFSQHELLKELRKKRTILEKNLLLLQEENENIDDSRLGNMFIEEEIITEKPKQRKKEKKQVVTTKRPKRKKMTNFSLITTPYNSNQSLLFPNENFYYLPDERETILSKLSIIESILLNLNEEENKLDFTKKIHYRDVQETNFDYFYQLELSKCNDEKLKKNVEDNFLSISRPYLKLSIAKDIMENKISLNEFGLKNGDLIHVPFSLREKTIVEQEMAKENFDFSSIKNSLPGRKEEDCIFFFKDYKEFDCQFEQIIEYDEKLEKKGIQNYVPFISHREIQSKFSSMMQQSLISRLKWTDIQSLYHTSSNSMEGCVVDIKFDKQRNNLVSISTGEQNNLKIFEMNSGKCIDLSGHKETVSDVFYSLDSSQIVTSSFDKKIKTWNSVTGELQNTFEKNEDVNGHTKSVVLLAPHSKKNVFASSAMDGQIILWDLQNKKFLWNLDSDDIDEQHYFSEIYFGFNETENNLYGIRDSKNNLGGLFCWDIESKLNWNYIDKESIIETFSVSPSGNYLSIGLNNGKARVFDSKSGKLITNIDKHRHYGSEGVTKISFSQCETYLQTCGDDRKIFIFDIRMQGKLLFKFEHDLPLISTEEGVTNADWSKSLGTTLLASSGSDQVVRVFDICSGSELGILEGHSDSNIFSGLIFISAISSVRWSHDNNSIASGGDNSILRLYSTDKSKKLEKDYQFYWQ
eukprot:gene6872-11034_t